MDKIEQLLNNFNRTAEEFFSLKEFKDLLASKKQIRIKYGVDVTAPHLHIGHAVNLWMMRKLQDLGHKIVFLIGDFTTQIGDPTGKNKTRPVISVKEIEKNTLEFIDQAKMVLRFDDPNLIEIRKNSEWYNKMPTLEFIKLASMITHARLISRDMFQKRMENELDIYAHELVYPILQGYDSVMLQSDLTIIGSDQLFNEMLGRFYQEKFGQKPQVIITTKITPGIDGKEKQSKSLGNYIGLSHSPRDKFGRVMTLPDNLILLYFEIYTEVPKEELEKISEMVKSNPLEAKKLLAMEIVRRYHGDQVAKEEREWFDGTFSQKETPGDIPVVSVAENSTKAMTPVVMFFDKKKSNNEISRLFKQGGVTLNGKKILDPQEVVIISDGDVFQVGKRNWFRIKIKDEK